MTAMRVMLTPMLIDASMRQSVPPKILEPIGRQLRIAYRVLDILVSHPSLDGPGIVAGVRQCIAAAVA